MDSNGHEFEQTPGESEGQGSLEFCSPWVCKQWGTTESLNNNNNKYSESEYARDVRD